MDDTDCRLTADLCALLERFSQRNHIKMNHTNPAGTVTSTLLLRGKICVFFDWELRDTWCVWAFALPQEGWRVARQTNLQRENSLEETWERSIEKHYSDAKKKKYRLQMPYQVYQYTEACILNYVTLSNTFMIEVSVALYWTTLAGNMSWDQSNTLLDT